MNTESLTDGDRQLLADHLTAGHKIEAIKFYREKVGCDLKTAKQDIEAMIDQMAEKDPEVRTRNQGGCAAVLVLGLALPAAIAVLENLL